MKFSYLILMKIVQIVATRGQILRQNAPNSISAGALPRCGSSQRSPRPSSWILGALLLREGGEGEGRGGKTREGKVKGGEERGGNVRVRE